MKEEDLGWLRERVDEKVMKLVLGRRRGKVFLVTGIKIARGLAVSREVCRSSGVVGKVSVSGIGTAMPVDLGPEVEVEGSRLRSEAFAGPSDVMFAYRVREIFFKTGRDGIEVVHKEFNKEAFMNTGEEKVSEQVPKIVF